MIVHGRCDGKGIGQAHALLSDRDDDLGSASGNDGKREVEIDGDGHHCHDRADAYRQCRW